MREPAGGASEREEDERGAAWQRERTAKDHEGEVDGGVVAEQRLRCGAAGAHERSGLRIGPAACDRVEQEPRAWIAVRIQRMADARDVLAAAQPVGERLAHAGGRTALVEERLHAVGVAAVKR